MSPPKPSPRSTVTCWVSWLANARSGRPSRLKSPTATSFGLWPAGTGEPGAGENSPLPSPRSTEASPLLSFATTMSSVPSPLTSTMATMPGPSPTAKRRSIEKGSAEEFAISVAHKPTHVTILTMVPLRRINGEHHPLLMDVSVSMASLPTPYVSRSPAGALDTTGAGRMRRVVRPPIARRQHALQSCPPFEAGTPPRPTSRSPSHRQETPPRRSLSLVQGQGLGAT